MDLDAPVDTPSRIGWQNLVVYWTHSVLLEGAALLLGSDRSQYKIEGTYTGVEN